MSQFYMMLIVDMLHNMKRMQLNMEVYFLFEWWHHVEYRIISCLKIEKIYDETRQEEKTICYKNIS